MPWIRRGLIFSLAAAVPAIGEPDIALVDGMLVDMRVEPGRPGGSTKLSLAQEIAAKQEAAAQMAEPRPPAPQERQRAQQLLQRVDARLAAGDWRMAFVEARDGLALDPNSLPLLSRAAVTSVQLREYSRADGYLARFLQLQPDNLHHISIRAGVLIRLGRIEEAEKLIERGMALNPEFVPLRIHRTTLRILQGRDAEDGDYWRRRTDEEWLVILRWLADDREILEKILGEPDYRRLTVSIVGETVVANLDELKNSLARALEHRAAKQPAAARAELENVIGAGLDVFGLRAAIAETLFQEGQVAESLGQWERLVGEYSNWAQAWLSRGYALLRAQRFDEALTSLRKALDLGPDEGVVKFAYACALALSGARMEAQGIFDKLIRTHRAQFRAWMESDPVLEKGVRSVVNAPMYLRALEIPPESE